MMVVMTISPRNLNLVILKVVVMMMMMAILKVMVEMMMMTNSPRSHRAEGCLQS